MKKIHADFKQYGVIGFIGRFLKYVLRKLGIKFNSYYFMVNEIDFEKLNKIWCIEMLQPKQLSYEDFKKGDKSVFTEEKIEILQKLLNDKRCLAYGIIENDNLVYSCMLSLDIFITSSPHINYKLKTEECLLFDSYCRPEYRRRGINIQMCLYRLMRAYEIGKRCCISIVLTENTASLKSIQKTGFKIKFKYYVFQIGKNVFTDFYRKKKLNYD